MNESGKRKAESGKRAAFTLIELLVVITIMGVLAGLTFPVLKYVKRLQYLKTASAEMEQIKTALDNYKAKYSVYPPGNPGCTSNLRCALTNQLYYELLGTTNINNPNNNSTPRVFRALDGSFQIDGTLLASAFGSGVSALANCSLYNGSGEDAGFARNFLSGLKPNRIGSVPVGGGSVSNLITSVRGPDASYQPLGVQDVNPFRYVYPGINNPGSYDLWVQLVISGQTNLICNWNKQVQINSPLP